MRTCAASFGDLFTLRIGYGLAPLVYCSDPEGLRVLLSQDEGPAITAPGDLNGIFEPLLGPQSVIGLSGNPHRRMRQLLMPPFHGERMRSYGEAISAICQSEADQWTPGAAIEVRPAMQRITMRTILRTVFGLRDGPRMAQLEERLVEMLEAFNQPWMMLPLYFRVLQHDLGPSSPWGRLLRQMEAINALLSEEIVERHRVADAQRDDILSLLLDARDPEGHPLTDGELRDELLTLLVAGHETTATALSWALYFLAIRPDVQGRLRQELVEASPAQERPLEVNALLRLPYLQAVCNETLRIHPVAMLTFPRRLEEPLTLAGHQLEAGTVVMGCIYLAHRRPQVFPEPEQFDPDRFLATTFGPTTFLPFGNGSRRCIGMAFALFEMKVVLSEVVRRFRVSLDPSTPLPVKPVRRGLTSGISKVMLQVREAPPQGAERPVS